MLNQQMASVPGFACPQSENLPAEPDNLAKKRLNIRKFPNFDQQAARSPVVPVSRTVPVQLISRPITRFTNLDPANGLAARFSMPGIGEFSGCAR